MDLIGLGYLPFLCHLLALTRALVMLNIFDMGYGPWLGMFNGAHYLNGQVLLLVKNNHIIIIIVVVLDIKHLKLVPSLIIMRQVLQRCSRMNRL